MSRSRNTTTISVATLALVLSLAGGAVTYSKHERDEHTVLPEDVASSPTSQAATSPAVSSGTATATPTAESSPKATSTATSTPTASSTYKDGTYSSQGSYNTPAGTQTIGVTLTLKDGVVTSASGTNMASDGESRAFQVDFIDTFPGRIIGKKISEVSFSRLAGSSLTTRGFNSAITSIKAKAS